MTQRFANPDEPYVTDRGSVILPDSEEPVTEIREYGQRASKIESSQARSITDLPAPNTQTQTVINVILLYQLMGLTDNEISRIIKANLEEVQKVKESKPYQETYDLLFEELIVQNKKSMVAKITHASTAAVARMVNLVDSGDKDIVRLKAAQDVLDRAGLSTDTLHGKNADDETELRIIVENASDSETNININVGK